MKKQRNSNIEILRIISILMIVVSHYCVHGVGRTVISNLKLGINRFTLEFFTMGNIGSILFVLISGYYLINSKEIKLKKIFVLIFQVLFYSITIYFCLLLFNIEKFNIRSFIINLFPITFKQYWFATTYFVLYLFHPFINKLLDNISRKDHFNLICIMFILFSVINTFTKCDFYGNELIQFIMFYIIGAYLSKYPDNKLINNNYKLMVISVILISLSIICFDILGNYIPIFGKHSTYLLSRTSPVAILFSVSFFDIFSRKKKFENRTINLISSLTFGVYLISDNNYLRSILWIKIFKNASYIYSSYLIIHIIISVVLTFIVCLIIEYLRKIIIENNFFKLFDLIFKKKYGSNYSNN